MDRVLVILSIAGSVVILCQWFVITRFMKYGLQRYGCLSRKTAYTILGALAVLNVVSVRVAINADILAVDTMASKVAAVLFFSYLGCVLALTLFFLFLGLVYHGLRCKDALFAGNVSPVPLPRALRGEKGCVQAGCLVSERGTGHGQLPDSLNTASDESSSSLPQRCVMHSTELPPTRRSFLKWTTAAGVVAVAGLAGKGVAEGYQRPTVPAFQLSHPSLEGLDRALTFIQVTDFHFGHFMGSEELERLVHLTNSIDADAVFMTGDLFHSFMSPVENATPILAKIRSRSLGNFAVLGNHDFYAGELRSVQSLKQSGWTLLRNEWITFAKGSASIHLGGIDDPMVNWAWGKTFPNFPQLMAKEPKEPGFRILLSHRPHVLPLAADAGIDLVLAGHMHGGQIILPVPGTDRGLSLAAIASRYTHGWYNATRTRMYLSRGCGLTFVPWRINCPPEITVFRLTPQHEGTYRVIDQEQQ